MTKEPDNTKLQWLCDQMSELRAEVAEMRQNGCRYGAVSREQIKGIKMVAAVMAAAVSLTIGVISFIVNLVRSSHP